jgi:hypothetical protein
MKKILKLTVLLCLAVLCIGLVTSCSSNRLDEPDDFRLNGDTLVLSWDKVKGAQSYLIEIPGLELPKSRIENEISLEFLKAGTYLIKIKAVGDNIETEDSSYATYEFVREAETGLKYELINNRTEYRLIGAGTASGDVVMESLYRGKPVTSIAETALYENDTITSFTVSKLVRDIGDKAFSKCSVLTSVTIPDNVTEVGERLFQSSKALVSVSLSSSLTEIKPYSFSWCSALKSVNIGPKVKSVGEYAFSNCKALESVVIPDSLVEIGEYAFSDCIVLKSITLPKVEVINDSAFSNCTEIASLSLGTNVKTIGNNAFRGCSKIASVTIPDSATTIGANAFLDCSSLATLKLGKGITDIGSKAFAATKFYNDAEGIVYADGWVIAAKDTQIDSLRLAPGTFGIAGYAFAKCKNLGEITLTGIKYIGDSAFNKCENLTGVTADNSLITIGNYAFANCPLLNSVSAGNSLERIGKYAFAGCSVLAEMELPDSLKSIGTYAFDKTLVYQNASEGEGVVYIGNWVVGMFAMRAYTEDIVLKPGTRGIADHSFYMVNASCNVFLPSSVKYIGRSAFYGAPVKTIVLSENLVSIGDYAFYGCTSVLFGNNGYTKIPDKVEYIGRSAFYGCEKVISLSIPASVKTIGAYAFYGCANLGATVGDEENPIKAEIIIAEGVTTIGERAFQGCLSLTEIAIPNSVTSLGSHAFYKCEALEKIKVGTGVTEIKPYTFYKCAALKEASISDSVKTIGDYAFRGCESLSSINLSGAKEIGKYAFYKCISLAELSFGDSLVSIGNYAFRGCIAVESVIIPESVTLIGKHAFYGMNNATIYAQADAAYVGWNAKFNTSYRPLFFGCTVTDGYVVSIIIKDGKTKNINEKNAVSDPIRAGFEFLGWATTADATTFEYTSETIIDVPENTTLYSIWTKTN